LIPVFVHLGLSLMLGLYIPAYLDTWFRQTVQRQPEIGRLHARHAPIMRAAWRNQVSR
jgi:hypothetical protein